MTARAPEMANPPEAQRSRYWARKASGFCVRGKSHGPAEPGRALCIGCLVDSRHDRRENYRRSHDPVNNCVRCGGDDGHNARSCTSVPLPGWRGPDPGRLARNKARHDRLRAAGLCINNPTHAKPQPGRSRCDACMSRRRKAKS